MYILTIRTNKTDNFSSQGYFYPEREDSQKSFLNWRDKLNVYFQIITREGTYIKIKKEQINNLASRSRGFH